MYDHGHFLKGGDMLQVSAYMFHVGLLLIGLLFLVGGTYGVVEEIIDTYKSGETGMYTSYFPSVCASITDHRLIGSVFSCADNSNSS